MQPNRTIAAVAEQSGSLQGPSPFTTMGRDNPPESQTCRNQCLTPKSFPNIYHIYSQGALCCIALHGAVHCVTLTSCAIWTMCHKSTHCCTSSYRNRNVVACCNHNFSQTLACDILGPRMTTCWRKTMGTWPHREIVEAKSVQLNQSSPSMNNVIVCPAHVIPCGPAVY